MNGLDMCFAFLTVLVVVNGAYYMWDRWLDHKEYNLNRGKDEND